MRIVACFEDHLFFIEKYNLLYSWILKLKMSYFPIKEKGYSKFSTVCTNINTLLMIILHYFTFPISCILIKSIKIWKIYWLKLFFNQWWLFTENINKNCKQRTTRNSSIVRLTVSFKILFWSTLYYIIIEWLKDFNIFCSNKYHIDSALCELKNYLMTIEIGSISL